MFESVAHYLFLKTSICDRGEYSMKKTLLILTAVAGVLICGQIYGIEEITLKVGENFYITTVTGVSGWMTAGGDTGAWDIESNQPDGIIQVDKIILAEMKQRLTFTALKKGEATIELSSFHESGSKKKTIIVTVTQ